MFDIKIKINGKPVQEFNHDGEIYIEGRVGTEYEIELKNNSWSRKMFVVSVDGLNIITGEPSSSYDKVGYIIGGLQNTQIKGFRVNTKDVASFKFVDKNSSYSKEITGSSNNCGVIGLKVYDEVIPLPNYNNRNNNLTVNPIPNWVTPLRKSYEPYSSNIMCSLSDSTTAPDFSIGTGWGKTKKQEIVEVDFKVGHLLGTKLIYYSTKKQLEKVGISFEKKIEIVKTMPSAFGETKFCKKPKNWKG